MKTNSINNTTELTMVKLLVSNGSRSSVIFLKALTTRSLYKALRDEKFLPVESTGKTSSESIEDGKALVVSFENITIDCEVVFDTVESEEVFLVASPEAQAAASGNSYGLSTNFGLVSKGELYFMEFNEEVGSTVMVGAEVHTAAFLAQINKREVKRAAKIAKSKEIHNLEVIKTLKKLQVNVESMDKELLGLIAEQALDLETAGNAYLQNDSQDDIKVQVQRLNPTSGRWYNAKAPNGKPMVAFLSAEFLFEYDINGNAIGLKTMDHGQTAIAYTMEKDFDATSVHNYHYVDKQTNELVFRSIEQRFIISGKAINSDVSIDGSLLVATEPSLNWTVVQAQRSCVSSVSSITTEEIKSAKFVKFQNNKVVKQFQFFGYDNLVDIGEGFYLMPSVDETYGADIEAAEYSEGIVLGKSVATATMSLDEHARFHINTQREEKATLSKISVDESRRANTKVKTAKELSKELKQTELYSWVLDRKQKTFDALKSASLQAELNMDLTAMKDQASEILEILKVITAETGIGFARPSWVVVNALAKKPAKDEKKASEADFRASVKSHILSNIDAINNGSLAINELHDEVIAEIYDVCKAGFKAGVSIKNKATAIQMREIAQKVKPVALPVSKGPEHSSVRNVKVS